MLLINIPHEMRDYHVMNLKFGSNSKAAYKHLIPDESPLTIVHVTYLSIASLHMALR